MTTPFILNEDDRNFPDRNFENPRDFQNSDTLVPIFQSFNNPAGEVVPVESPITPPVQQNSIINLSDIIEIDKYAIDRNYTKGTLAQIPEEILRFTNTSTDIDVRVEIDTIEGVIFEPRAFNISKGTSINVKIKFDSVEVNKLQSGLSSINCIINLSSLTAVLPAPPILPPQSPIVQPPQQTVKFDVWLEKRYIGMSNIETISSNFINGMSPSVTREISNITYRSGIGEKTFITFNRNFNWTEGDIYRFFGKIDDGIRIYVNNNLIYNNWKLQSETDFSVNYSVPSTGIYSVLIEYFNNERFGIIELNNVLVGRVTNNSPSNSPRPNTPRTQTGGGSNNRAL